MDKPMDVDTDSSDYITPPDLSGSMISQRYLLIERIGIGAMGEVYRAQHMLMKNFVALKLLHPEMAANEDILMRFQREAQATANIHHSNVCSSTDFGRTEDGTFFLVMEYLDGRTLSQAIEVRGCLPPYRALNILRQIASALSSTHALGIIHRDLKPDNIFLIHEKGNTDHVKVLDFGIAHVYLEENGITLTRAGEIYGTPLYMSPEQGSGETIDHRADLYSLGALLFHMLAGRPPFMHKNLMKVLAMHFNNLPPRLEDVAPQCIGPGLSKITRKLLEKTIQRRYESADALISAIDALDLSADLAAAPPINETLVPINFAEWKGETIVSSINSIVSEPDLKSNSNALPSVEEDVALNPPLERVKFPTKNSLQALFAAPKKGAKKSARRIPPPLKKPPLLKGSSKKKGPHKKRLAPPLPPSHSRQSTLNLKVPSRSLGDNRLPIPPKPESPKHPPSKIEAPKSVRVPETKPLQTQPTPTRDLSPKEISPDAEDQDKADSTSPGAPSHTLSPLAKHAEEVESTSPGAPSHTQSPISNETAKNSDHRIEVESAQYIRETLATTPKAIAREVATKGIAADQTPQSRRQSKVITSSPIIRKSKTLIPQQPPSTSEDPPAEDDPLHTEDSAINGDLPPDLPAKSTIEEEAKTQAVETQAAEEVQATSLPLEPPPSQESEPLFFNDLFSELANSKEQAPESLLEASLSENKASHVSSASSATSSGNTENDVELKVTNPSKITDFSSGSLPPTPLRAFPSSFGAWALLSFLQRAMIVAGALAFLLVLLFNAL